MKRTSILILLMALVAACGSDGASPSATETESEPDATVEATPSTEPSDEPSTEPGASSGTGYEGDLAALIPDELNGVPKTDIPGMESMFAGILGGQGVDAAQAQFAFATYGEGTDAVTLTAFAVPGMSDTTLELISRSFSGVEGVGEAETVTIDGKSVLRVSGGAQPGVVYMYISGGAAFTVISQNEDLAEQLLAELP